MGIMKNALRERLRRKDIYVVIIIGILIVMMCMSGAATLSIDGVPVTDFSVMMPLVMNVVSVIAGGIAVALSLGTIPNEYERRTSHLVWIRHISQWRYHGQLALSNMISSIGALFILYTGVIVFAGIKGEYTVLVRSIPAFLLFSVSTAAVSLFTSAVSLKLPGFAAGVLAAVFMLAGTMHPVLETLAGIVSGVASGALKGVLFVIPNLYRIESQAGNFLSGKTIQIHDVIGGILLIYLFGLLLYLFRRKEA